MSNRGTIMPLVDLNLGSEHFKIRPPIRLNNYFLIRIITFAIEIAQINKIVIKELNVLSYSLSVN